MRCGAMAAEALPHFLIIAAGQRSAINSVGQRPALFGVIWYFFCFV